MAKKSSKIKIKACPERSRRVDKDEAAQRAKKIWPILQKTYPNAKSALNFRNPFQMLISTILSAQCTDARVNIVTAKVFKKYKSPADWAKAGLEDIESDIRSTGFYHNKAVSIKNASKAIIEKFDGSVPDTLEDLVALPGVGRKTANVVLGNAFGRPAIACDTHVIRLSRRLRLSSNSDPVKLEFDLAEILPKGIWTVFSHALILHGRTFCKARKPDCGNCPIRKYCPSADNPDLW
jgi:endonuclease-3